MHSISCCQGIVCFQSSEILSNDVLSYNQSWVYSGVALIPFQVYFRSGVEAICSTPGSGLVIPFFNKNYSVPQLPSTLLHGVEHLYSKILLRNGVERSSGVGVDSYTQYKTCNNYYLTLFIR